MSARNRPDAYAWLPFRKGRIVGARFRAENALRDLWDRRARRRCCAMPMGLPSSPGYHFWRCGLQAGHDGAHRTGAYLWDELSPGNGASIYSPPKGFWPPMLNRRTGRTRRQRRLYDAWHAERNRQREQEARDAA